MYVLALSYILESVCFELTNDSSTVTHATNGHPIIRKKRKEKTKQANKNFDHYKDLDSCQ